MGALEWFSCRRVVRFWGSLVCPNVVDVGSFRIEDRMDAENLFRRPADDCAKESLVVDSRRSVAKQL